MEKVGVVICNYNKENEVLTCIQSVLESKFMDLHIYVVDNASKDHSVENIKMKYTGEPRLTLLCNKENLGGSGGFNTGLRMALKKGHKYLMCVDNDAFLDENCIGVLSDFLDQNEKAGIAAAKIFHTQEPDYIQQYGSFINWKDYCVDSTYLNYAEDGTLPEVIYSDAVPACALMIRRTVVEKIGLMPEENFLYWDDTEWCYRCTLAGYLVASVGSAEACHAMGAKKEEVNTFPTYYAWRNWISFFLKYIPDEQLSDMAEVFLNSIFTLQYEGLFRGEENRAKTVMAALDDALHGRMGKAGEDRIFPIEGTYRPLDALLGGKNKEKAVRIIYGEFPLAGEKLAAELMEKEPGRRIFLQKEQEKAELEGNAEQTEFVGEQQEYPVECGGEAIELRLCEDIFRVEDLTLQSYYIDLDGNVLATEEDVLIRINAPYARSAFLFAEKPLFLRLARELRENLRQESRKYDK